jgi:two-component system, OmpR family, sensor histidine kinase MtrB
MSERTLRLHTMVTAVTSIAALLAVTTATSLVVLTHYLNDTIVLLSASEQSLQLVENVEVDLLLHARATDADAQRAIETQLQRKLARAEGYITNDPERATFTEAVKRVDRYLGHPPGPESVTPESITDLELAYQALDRVVDMQTNAAATSLESTARWGARARLLGIVLSVVLIGLLAWILWWLKRYVFQPLFSLAGVMTRFAQGERKLRAEERGATELREMALRFNDMAAALAAQREAQLASLAAVAHDLRNPLSALQLAACSVRSDEPLPSEPLLRRVLGTFERQVALLLRMLGDFIEAARTEAGELELELRLADADARELVQHVVALFEPSSPKHRFNVNLPDTSIPLYCDALRIEQVLTNLLSNAIKYSPSGGPIEVALRLTGVEVTLAVTDHGVGIQSSDMPMLFEPFRRVGQARESIPGVGLGLHIVRRIVAAHGGRIEVESTPGRGSTFRVLLPLARRTAAEAPEPVNSSAVACGSQT